MIMEDNIKQEDNMGRKGEDRRKIERTSPPQVANRGRQWKDIINKVADHGGQYQPLRKSLKTL